MLRQDRTDRPPPGTAGHLRHLREAALAVGSGYQRNREAVEPALRVGIDLLAFLVLLAQRRTRSTSGTVSVLPSEQHGDISDSVASGTPR